MIIITCHTDGCANEDVQLPQEFASDQYFCGVCGSQISDVQEIDNYIPPPPPQDPPPVEDEPEADEDVPTDMDDGVS